jgi:hypothetical protein
MQTHPASPLVLWCVVCGVWCMVCGVWCVVCGVWCVVCCFTEAAQRRLTRTFASASRYVAVEKRREYLVALVSPLHARLQAVLSSDIFSSTPHHAAVTSALTRILEVRHPVIDVNVRVCVFVCVLYNALAPVLLLHRVSAQNYSGFTKAESMPDRDCVWPLLLPVLDVSVTLLDSYHCLGPVSRSCLSYFQAFIEAHVRARGLQDAAQSCLVHCSCVSQPQLFPHARSHASLLSFLALHGQLPFLSTPHDLTAYKACGGLFQTFSRHLGSLKHRRSDEEEDGKYKAIKSLLTVLCQVLSKGDVDFADVPSHPATIGAIIGDVVTFGTSLVRTRHLPHARVLFCDPISWLAPCLLAPADFPCGDNGSAASTEAVQQVYGRCQWPGDRIPGKGTFVQRPHQFLA